MRLNSSNSALFSFSCLLSLTASLPLFPRHIEPLIRRATYSVVPVDGGPAATDVANETPAASVIISTIVQTQTAVPQTVIQTDKVTLSPTTDTEISTKTVGSERTQTHVVTVPSPTTTTIVISTGYSIVNANSPTVTVEEPAPVRSSPASTESKSPSPTSANPATVESSTAISPSSESTSHITTHTSISASIATQAAPAPTTDASSVSTISATRYTSSAVSQTNSVSSLAPATLQSPTSAQVTAAPTSTYLPGTSSAALPTSTGSPYDDGSWHTTYPTWSNSTRTATEAVQMTSTVSVSGSYSNTPVTVPANSVRGPVFDAINAELEAHLFKRITTVWKRVVSLGTIKQRDSPSRMTPEEKRSKASDPFYL